MRKTVVYPIPVKRVLKKMGEDMKEARIRRRISSGLMAARAGISRPTLAKVEKGDPATSLGIYAKVLFVLGMTDKLSDLADIKYDQTGLLVDSMALPKRVRNKKEH